MARELELYADPQNGSGMNVDAVLYLDGWPVGDPVALTEQSPGIYVGDMPAHPPGVYVARFYDGSELLTQDVITWSGTAEVDLLDLFYSSGIFVEVASELSGTEFPLGSSSYPVANLADALAIAAKQNTKRLRLTGDLALDAPLDAFTIDAEAPGATLSFTPDATMSGGVSVTDCIVTGTLNGRIRALNSTLRDFGGAAGLYRDCGLQGTLSFAAGEATLIRPFSSRQNNPAILELDQPDSDVNVLGLTGDVVVKGLKPESKLNITLLGGSVTLDRSCVGGEVILSGVGSLVDLSEGTSVTSHGLLQTDPAPQLGEVHARLGLDRARPVVTTDNSTTIGEIELEHALSNGSVRVERRDL